MTIAQRFYQIPTMGWIPPEPFEPYNRTQARFYESNAFVNGLSGAVRAGKSRPLVQKALSDALRYPGGRFAIVRKVRSSLNETTLRSFLVDACGWSNIDDASGDNGLLKSWSISKFKGIVEGGSEILFFGLDKAADMNYPSKIGSMELTRIYIDEAIELAENDFNMLSTRLSYQVNGSTPQISFATNPGSPQHWIHRRFIAEMPENATIGKLNTFDNPHLDEAYRTQLAALPKESNFYKRMVLGEWIAYLGMVFDAFDAKRHIVDSVPQPTDTSYNFRAFDYGGANPYSGSWYRYFPETDTLYHYRQAYWSEIGATDFGQMINQHQPKNERIRYTVSDHDVSDRIDLMKQGIRTIRAIKDVRRGINAVNQRLMVDKLFFVRDALIERDPELASEDSLARRVRPQSTLEEIPSYEWGVTAKGVPTDEPNKMDDHGCDELRYAVMSVEHPTEWNAHYVEGL